MKKIIGYKLLKTIPNGILNSIYTWNGASYSPQESGYTYDKKMVENQPEFFEAVYEEESQTWKKGEWLYFKGFNPSKELIVRFDSINNNDNIVTKEYYTVYADGDIYEGESDNYIDKKNVTKATPEQIQRILTIVAKHKGFVEGVKVNQKPAYNGLGDVYKLNSDRSDYDFVRDNLAIDGCGIYREGKWAEIVKEPQFKAKDWVLLKGNNTGNGLLNDSIVQLLEIDRSKYSTGNLIENSHFMFNFKGSFYNTEKQYIIRLATAEEIAEATKPKLPIINSYDGRFEGDYVVYGCARIHIDFFYEMVGALNCMSDSNRRLSYIMLDSNVHITSDQIKEILNSYRSITRTVEV